MTDVPSILHHASVGTTDMERARAFYDAVLTPLGARRVMDVEHFASAWGKQWPEFWVGLPHDQGAPSAGNGAHFAFVAPDQEAVRAFHAAGLANGGTDDGAPGPRPMYGPDYYGAFLLDPDGNKIEAAIIPPGEG